MGRKSRRLKTVTDRMVASMMTWYMNLPQTYLPRKRNEIYMIEFCNDLWRSLPIEERFLIFQCISSNRPIDFIIPLKHIKDLARTSACG